MTEFLIKGIKVLIDTEDYERISKYKWYIASHGYACRKTRKEGMVYLHRFILNAPAGLFVDHANGNKLDNSKSNLRLCTKRENQRNRPVRKQKSKTSKYKGVRFAGTKQCKNRPWVANIRADKRMFLGSFSTEEEAARAYDAAAKIYHKEFALLNFKYDGN